MSLITKAELKEFLHLDESHDDALLDKIIAGAEAQVSRKLHQSIEESTIEEYHDGDRTNTILLNNGLISEVSKVEIDTDHDGEMDYTLTPHEEYEWYTSGLIRRRNGCFSRGLKSIKVTYKCGYSSVIVIATNLPRNVGFTIHEERPVRVCLGFHSGLAGVKLNSAADGAGITYNEHIDFECMNDTGEVVIIASGDSGITDGDTVYIEEGTYTKYSNLPEDLRMVLKQFMSNIYHGTIVAIEVEGSPKVFSNAEINSILDTYRRIAI